MRKKVWLAIALVMILSAMFFPASGTKQALQTQPAAATQSEVQNTWDRSADLAEQTRRLQEDRLGAEATALEVFRTAFVNENVHFPFDSAVLSDRAQQILHSKAGYLRNGNGPDITVTIEGHCDARGTDAYNMALGERRAESVKNFLVDLGISSNRLNTISWGEHRPIAMGENEASWARNRRAQFMIN